jgi:hypothetical protein
MNQCKYVGMNIPKLMYQTKTNSIFQNIGAKYGRGT